MHRVRRRRPLLWASVALLSLVALACGGRAAAPGQEQAPAAVTQLQQSAANFDIVDPSKFPEPAEDVLGGIPKADLEATPKRGGTLKLDAGGYRSLDPLIGTVASERFFARSYANGLLTWDLKTNSPVLDLAESWQMASDGMSYTFKIRKGAKFHNLPPVNGRELTAEDVKWSLDRISGLSRKPGQLSYHYARFATVQEFQLVDGSTLRMVLKQRDNIILRELMYELSIVLPKEAAIDGEFGEGKTLIGTGPFIVDLAQVQGLTRVKRNPDYFKKGPDDKPYLDGMELHQVAAGVIGAALKSRQLDWILTSAHPVAKGFFGNPEMRVYSTRGVQVGTTGVWMNPYVEPMKDVRVRRAIHLAIDRDEYIVLTQDGGAYPTGFLGGYWQPWFWPEAKLRSLPGWRQNKEEDYAEARKLMAEAGYASGLTITCQCESPPVADVLAQQLKRVGIDLKVNAVDLGVLRNTAYMRDKQLAFANQGAGHTPSFALTQGYLCGSPANLSTICDDEIERLFKDFRQEPDQKKMVELMDQIQQRLHDLMVVAPTARNIGYYISYRYVRGWRNSFCDARWCHGDDAANVWLDK